MISRTIIFRSIFIILAVLMAANLCVNLFTAAKEPTPIDYNIQAEYPPDAEMPSYDELAGMLKDFQLDVQYNGDILIYALEGNDQVYVGVHKYGSKCDLLENLTNWMKYND